MSLSIGSLHSASSPVSASSPLTVTTAATAAAATTANAVNSATAANAIINGATNAMTWETSGCPSSPFDGWTHTSDCTTYYWCKEGKRASLDYTCPGGQLFDEGKGRCDNAVDVVCSGGLVVDGAGAGAGAGSAGESSSGGSAAGHDDGGLGHYLSQALQDADPNSNAGASANSNTNSNTGQNATDADPNAISQELLDQQAHWASLNRPLLTPAELTILKTHPNITLVLRPPIYFPSVADTACYSVYDLNPPDWMDVLQMFQLKYDCCETTFRWMDLNSCLGDGFVEINYQVEAPYAPTSVPSAPPTASLEPTASPTLKPTDSVAPTASPVNRPTAAPSSSPSDPATETPSTAPSLAPTTSPTISPSATPTTSEPTGRPTTNEPTTGAPSASPVRVHFVVEKVRDGGGASGGGDADGAVPLASEYFAEYFSIVAAAQDGGPDAVVAAASSELLEEEEDDKQAIDVGIPLPTNVTLAPLADATISKHRPDLNFGNNPKLAVDAGSSPSDAANGIYVETFETLLQFDFASVPFRDRHVESILLELFSQSECIAGVRFYYLTSSAKSISKWKEEEITWSTAPVPTGGDRYVVSTAEVGTNEWSVVDLTGVVMSALDNSSGSQNGGGEPPGLVTIRIRASPQSSLRDRCVYSSKEDGQGDRAPRVVVNYAVADEDDQEEVAEDGATLEEAEQEGDEELLLQPQSGHMPTASFNDPLLEMAMEAPLPPLSQTHIYAHPLPPSASGDFTLLRAIDDATIHLTYPSNSYGTLPVLAIQFDTYRRNIMDSLIRFDIRTLWQEDSGAVAARTLPSTAILTLFAMGDCTSAGTIVATTTQTRRLSDGGEITLGAWNQEKVNWNNAPSTSILSADVHGNDGDDDDVVFRIGTFGSVSANFWHGFDVVDAVRWAVRKGKEEITFRISGNVEKLCEFASLESGRAPKLMVVFQ
ncbi:hypothetical protein ACHAXS_009961 [Conticribra weissflogii]